MKRVRVRWEDHETIALWHTIGDPLPPAIPDSEGRLVEETDEYIVLALTICGNEYNAAQKILKKNIVGEIEEIP